MRYISTRSHNSSSNSNFSKVIMEGLSADGGLYIPQKIPTFSSSELENMVNMNYTELCAEVIFKYCGTCFTKEDIKNIAIDSYKNFGKNEIAPMVNVSDNIDILELFHGPTLAFKDFALQFLSRVFNTLLGREGKKITIIGATSGDTGSAAIEAFKVAGASRAMNTIMIQCKDTSNRKFKDSNSNDFAKAAEMFA